MKRIGVVAGGGTLPLEFISSAKERGSKVIAFAINGMADKKIEENADKTYWMDVGHYRKLLFLLLKERVRHIALIGKIDKNIIYEKRKYDKSGWKLMKNLENNKDYSILAEVTRHFKRFGIEVIDTKQYLSHLIPEVGVLSRAMPDRRIEEDILFGYNIAKRTAEMEIGQTIIVKNKAVVAVEAMEGTDMAMQRAGEIAGEGCVMIKVGRPKQDMRWDVPTVGLDTVNNLAKYGFSALAIESDKMFLVDRKEFLWIADNKNIVVQVL